MDIELVSAEEAAKQDALPVYHRRYGLIRIRRNWNARLKDVGPTKGGYWRTVPISSELYAINIVGRFGIGVNDAMIINFFLSSKFPMIVSGDERLAPGSRFVLVCEGDEEVA